MRRFLPVAAAILAAACTVEQPAPLPTEGNGPAATRPADAPATAVYEGVLSPGTECAILTTDAGTRWSLSTADGEDRYYGKRLRIEAEIADASFCMEGEGTLIPHSITLLDD
ncbi:DUF5818 domain-containing protein [Sphingomicrobium astaxanthinifaciens]|uniref:DUF5818 domain-containing protein n=1 Tax=Sphingomicrobium astaxanthinifaciens TaxID=1227949 RepID=UPI001FCBC6E8|nr:DUF5818 domain-containing protein [Sphingomicrobium astaxanthinifaciens]MCJ7422279.1 DUF5818 domain-containing protein [Sphingomicrobium astaxanthinifaciens]